MTPPRSNSAGPELIKLALLDDDPRPLHLQAWGGTNTIAAALRSIEDEYHGSRDWPSAYRRVVSKAQLYIILDQDETYKDYIDPHWPDLNVVVNRDQFWTVAYFRYRYSGERGLPRVPEEIENAYFKPPFIQQRIRFSPLLSSYPISADAYGSGATDYPNTEEFLSEGDSPSYFGLLDNGLRNWQDPTYGGWEDASRAWAPIAGRTSRRTSRIPTGPTMSGDTTTSRAAPATRARTARATTWPTRRHGGSRLCKPSSRRGPSGRRCPTRRRTTRPWCRSPVIGSTTARNRANRCPSRAGSPTLTATSS